LVATGIPVPFPVKTFDAENVVEPRPPLVTAKGLDKGANAEFETVQFGNDFKIIFCTSVVPIKSVNGADLVARILSIPFPTKTFPKGKRDNPVPPCGTVNMDINFYLFSIKTIKLYVVIDKK
jgi:hypothetical protein